jgi:hypothetical protein
MTSPVPIRRLPAPCPLVMTLLCLLLLSGCAATRSEIREAYTAPVAKRSDSGKVSVFFLFRHLEQSHGLDTIPKLKGTGVKDFDNLVRDSLSELGNLGKFSTDTELPTDVNSPERREKREANRGKHDFTVEISIFEESSFRQQCFSAVVSTLSLTAVPMPYSWDYTVTATVYDKGGARVKEYRRAATLNNWLQGLLVFAYPFYPLEGKREEIYSETLHNIFRQMDGERVLK